MSLLQKLPSDIVILSALRTPFTKAVKGGLAKMYPEELLHQVLAGTIERTGIDPLVVDDVVVGAVLQTLGGHKASALAVKTAGFPVSTTVSTINRQCASSAQALSYAAASIRAGEQGVCLVAGVESMTHDYFPHRGIPTRIAPALFDRASAEARSVLMPMGITSENVALEFGVSRTDQDQFAFRSQQKAAAAAASGHLGREILPVLARTSEEGQTPVYLPITADDGIRGSVTVEKLGTLKPAFSATGTTTAGNASQISDGASAVLIATRAKAAELGLKPLGRYLGCAVAGVPSHLMGIGPSAAVPLLLSRLGLTTQDIDLFELNEAFASQSLYCIRQLGLDEARVNPYGGAIALGHPLGATGGRLVATVLNGLKAQNKTLGVISMCTSTGQGYAALFANE